MAHLTCGHKRRVMVLPSTRTLHRKDGTACDKALLKIGGNVYDPRVVAEHHTRSLKLR